MKTDQVLAFILFELCFVLLVMRDTRTDKIERLICFANAMVCMLIGILLILGD